MNTIILEINLYISIHTQIKIAVSVVMFGVISRTAGQILMRFSPI